MRDVGFELLRRIDFFFLAALDVVTECFGALAQRLDLLGQVRRNGLAIAFDCGRMSEIVAERSFLTVQAVCRGDNRLFEAVDLCLTRPDQANPTSSWPSVCRRHELGSTECRRARND